MLIDRLEKVGRIVLWLSISLASICVPVAYARQLEAERRAGELLRTAAEKASAEAADAAKEALEKAKPSRLPLSSMSRFLRAFNQSRAEGHVWFTNVSPSSGFVCIEGTVTNPSTGASSTSLPSCRRVEAYESLVEMTLMFPGGNVSEICTRDVTCSLKVDEASAP